MRNKEEVERWLNDIEQRNLKVVCIIAYKEGEQFFYGWGDSIEGKQQFIKQLRSLADSVENGTGNTFVNIKLP